MGILQLLGGIILLLVGLWLIVPVPGFSEFFAGFAFGAFKTVLAGSIPVLLVLFGLLLVWISLDEMRSRK